MAAEQPTELREYLVEAETLVREWYSREGLEETHERNIANVATLMCLHALIEPELPFEARCQAARLYLVAAFQMGRQAGTAGE